MYKNKLGQFNIQVIDTKEHFVRLWTDAPVNSPRAKEWFNRILTGPGGIAEIDEVIVGDQFLALDFSGEVRTEDQIKHLVRSFMHLVDAESKKLDYFDLHAWRYAATPDIESAMAIDSVAGPDYYEAFDRS